VRWDGIVSCSKCILTFCVFAQRVRLFPAASRKKRRIFRCVCTRWLLGGAAISGGLCTFARRYKCCCRTCSEMCLCGVFQNVSFFHHCCGNTGCSRSTEKILRFCDHFLNAAPWRLWSETLFRRKCTLFLLHVHISSQVCPGKCCSSNRFPESLWTEEFSPSNAEAVHLLTKKYIKFANFI